MGLPVAIIGGGISGLSTAYYLAQAGIPSTLIEARPRLGGVIQTEQVEGCVVEAGPDSFLSVKPAAMELIRELGLAGDVIGSNDHLRKTYVWKGGRLMPLPDGLMMMVPTRILPMITTPLLSWPTKVRMGWEWFRAPGLAPRDRSVAEFVSEHYGDEAVDYLAEPLLAGIYGGSPQALSVRSVLPKFVELEARYGSLTRGVLAERRAARGASNHLPLFRSLKGGLGQLVKALESAIAGKAEVLRQAAELIERENSGYRIRLQDGWLPADRVVLACEAHRAAALAASLQPAISDLLAAVPYSSSMTVALGFRREAFARPLRGFGFLVPKRERRRLVACTWVGTKFPYRVPEGLVLLRCFLGGTDQPEILSETDQDVIASVLEELGAIVGISSQPLFTRVFRWPRSMAQYPVGHQQRLEELNARLEALPGLYLAGNAYQGIGIPDCIRTGKQAAEAILRASANR